MAKGQANTSLIVLIIIIAVVIIAGAILIGFSMTGEVTKEQNKDEDFVCNSPYIQVGNDCCLDNNANSVCDNDEANGKTYCERINKPHISLICQNKTEEQYNYCTLKIERDVEDEGWVSYLAYETSTLDLTKKEQIPGNYQLPFSWRDKPAGTFIPMEAFDDYGYYFEGIIPDEASDGFLVEPYDFKNEKHCENLAVSILFKDADVMTIAEEYLMRECLKASQLTINTESGYTCYDGLREELLVMVGRGSTDIGIEGIQISIKDSRGKWFYNIYENYASNDISMYGGGDIEIPDRNEERTYIVDNIKNPTKISIASIIYVNGDLETCSPVYTLNNIPAC